MGVLMRFEPMNRGIGNCWMDAAVPNDRIGNREQHCYERIS